MREDLGGSLIFPAIVMFSGHLLEGTKTTVVTGRGKENIEILTT